MATFQQYMSSANMTGILDSYSDSEPFDVRELERWESNESNTSDPAWYESEDDTCVHSS